MASLSPSHPSSAMEAEWPPLNKSAQFKCDMLAQYLQKFHFEDDEDDAILEYEYENSDADDDSNSDADEEGEGKGKGKGEREVRVSSYKIGNLKEFLKQVRTTRGYNVDAAGTWFFNSPFRTVIPEILHNYDIVLSKAIEVAINHINSKTGKVYKHVRTLRVVDSPHRLLLLTFTAKTTDAVEHTADACEQTFLATVYAPTFLDPIEKFELLECFLKPEGPAPWGYLDFKSYVDLKEV